MVKGPGKRQSRRTGKLSDNAQCSPAENQTIHCPPCPLHPLHVLANRSGETFLPPTQQGQAAVVCCFCQGKVISRVQLKTEPPLQAGTNEAELEMSTLHTHPHRCHQGLVRSWASTLAWHQDGSWRHEVGWTTLWFPPFWCKLGLKEDIPT